MPTVATEIAVEPLEEGDLADADAVFRLAFGTALGLPEPARFAEGAELVRTRWRAAPGGAFKAVSGGELVGCALVARWGSSAVLGPLAVRPDWWDRGVGHLLWEARLPLLERWGATHAALFTRPEPKNVHLYQRFDFWPGSLTALTAKQLTAGGAPATETAPDVQVDLLDECRRLTDAVYPGLDLEREIRMVADQGLGETVLVRDEDGLAGFAICHAGAGSEAGPGACFVKFAAARPGAEASARFTELLEAVEAYAAARGLSRLVAGVNTARHEAYRTLLERGHRTLAFGVAMHRGNEPAYDRPGVYVLDDRR
jgi:GNAT superfamily N-acetyltransferase